MSELDRRIRERAYRLWLDEGQPEGREQEHWHRAAAQIAEEDRQPPTAEVKPARATRPKRGDAKLDGRDRDGVSRTKPVPTAADDAVKRDKPARAGRKAAKLIDPGR